MTLGERLLSAAREMRSALCRKPDPVGDGLLAIFNSRRKFEVDVDMALRKAISKPNVKGS